MAGDAGSVPGSGRSPGGGNGNPAQYSCLESPMDRGAQRAMVRGVARVGHDLATDTLTIQPEHLLTDLLNACLLAHEGVVIRSLRFRMFFCALSL